MAHSQTMHHPIGSSRQRRFLPFSEYYLCEESYATLNCSTTPAVLAGAVLGLLIVGLLWTTQDWRSPARTLEAFCRALLARDYPTAYAHLSPAYQDRLPYATFVTAYRVLPAPAGSSIRAANFSLKPLGQWT